jgi:glycosyltransferase involved in cell wall biosynthesis
MKILWICGLPRAVQREVLPGENYGVRLDWPWILGHLPPPENVELHIACRTPHYTKYREFSYRGAHFYLIPVKARARIFFLFRLDWFYFRKLARRLKPDVVHGWGTEDAYASVALKLAPEQHVIEVQGNLNAYLKRVKMHWFNRLAAWNERLVLARARHVAAENEYSLGSALDMIRTKSVHAIEHPIRAEFLTAPPAGGDAKQILFLGTIEERKGIWDAIVAFRRAAPPDWKMAVIGNGTAESVAKMERLISNHHLAGRICHYPQLSPAEMLPLMQSSSIFLLPTRIDTGPTALKESMAMGLWPVCYDNSGPAHYIRKFKYGDLAKDLNLDSLTENLRAAISSQPWKTTENHAKIISHIRPHFDRMRIWKELTDMYAKICEM